MKRFIPGLLLLSACASSAPDFASSKSERAERREPSVARLRAGETNDNDAFDDYLRYFKAYPERDVRKIDVTDRSIVTFVDWDGNPIADAPVRFTADGAEVYRARTTAAGQVMLPSAALGVRARTIEATVDGKRVSFRREDRSEVTVNLPQPERDEIDVDIAFCLDTTGSMGDEIDRIKSTMNDVVERLGRLSPRPRLRWGMVCYRDRGDEYVTKRFQFTTRLADFVDDLDHLRAEAGGDYEEDVNAGLDAAVNQLDWSRRDAIRVLFLIGDAPPHTDLGTPYVTSMRTAVEKGIKIYTIAASGLNDRGEFIWRQLAQFTLAKFMFISYGGSTPHHVGGYKENNLDDLMVRAVKGELESLRARPSPRRQQPREYGRGREPDDFREWQK